MGDHSHLVPGASLELDWLQSSRSSSATMAGRRRPVEMALQRQAFSVVDHYSTTLEVDLPARGLSLEDIRGSELLQHFTCRGFELARESLPSWDEVPIQSVEDFRGRDG